MNKKKLRKSRTTRKPKGRQRSKVLTETVVETYLKNLGKIRQTARELKIDKNTVYSHLRSKEGQTLIKNRSKENKIIMKERRYLMNDLYIDILKKVLTESEIDGNHALTLLSHFLGYSPEIQALKIKAKELQQNQTGNSEDSGLSQEDLERYRKLCEEK